MAKKKRKNKGINKILSFIPIVLSIVVIGLMFLDVVKFTGKLLGSEITYSGFNVIFGLTEKSEVLGATIKTEILGFSILALIAVILPFVGACVQMSKNKLVKLIAFIVTIIGAVLIFIMPSFVVFATDVVASTHSVYTASLAVGGIIAGIVASIQALVIGYSLLQK